MFPHLTVNEAVSRTANKDLTADTEQIIDLCVCIPYNPWKSPSVGGNIINNEI